MSFQGTVGLSGLGGDYGESLKKIFGGDFYNYGAGLVLNYPLGNRSAISTYNKRQLEAKHAETSLANVRQYIIIGVREAVRRVQTDFKRIETTRSARILAERQLQTEQERLKVGLSTTRFVLDFQHDLGTAQGHELQAIVAISRFRILLAIKRPRWSAISSNYRNVSRTLDPAQFVPCALPRHEQGWRRIFLRIHRRDRAAEV